jgi:hypothetical protein
MTLSSAALAARSGTGQTQQPASPAPVDRVEPDKLLLKITVPNRYAKYWLPRSKGEVPVWDAHCHPRAKTAEDVAAAIKIT